MINYNLWTTRQHQVKEYETSRTPLLYSLPCVVHRLFVHSLCHGSLCVWRLTVLCLLRPYIAPAFYLCSRLALPCPPASCTWFSSCSWCCPLLSCQTWILCAPALSLVSVMRAAFVFVLFRACNPVSCCSCFCRSNIPAPASVLCRAPVDVLIPVCSPSRALFPFAGQAVHTPLCILGVTWRRHGSPSPAMLETWSVKPSLQAFGCTLPGLKRCR